MVGRLALIGVAAAINGCLPATNAGTLPPTLTVEPIRGGDVAFQNGIPVPSFGTPSRASIRLNGAWRVERTELDSQLSLTPRDASLPRIEEGGAGRHLPDYDDGRWDSLVVPGSLNPPPDRRETGGWYRRAFSLPEAWVGRTLTLKFGAANYLADVWLNGTWLGYHEGGSTPFAFDATAAAHPGERNVLAVRVDNPAWGSRNDIVPWGLADWWNFGGLTRPVWIEAAAPVHAVRADVVPHLDGADVSVVVRNAGPDPAEPVVTVEVFPADIADPNPLNPDPRALVSPDALSIIRTRLPEQALAPGDVVRLETSFLVDGAAPWTPLSPSLYVLRVTVEMDGEVVDRLHETFGFRQVALDPDGPAVLLNGRRVMLTGAALHDQVIDPGSDGGGHIPDRAEILTQLRRAASIGIHLIRTGHTPANPDLLGLADRLGFAVWEEIPLYHYTPQTYEIAMRRGIPQQMLREMALRDMNRPSVLFHGLSNESTGEEARVRSLQELHDIDRAIDGTRLTGQAAYGFAPTDSSSAPLDVAGYTFYHGVFYGADAAADTTAALEAAHRTYPEKPIVILEYGRWADGPGGLEAQRHVFEQTAPALFSHRAALPGGFVSAAVWWTLEDYATLRPNLAIEHFGMVDTSGSLRPVAGAARAIFADLPQGIGAPAGDPAPPRTRPLLPTGSGRLMLVYLGYGAAMVVTILALVLGALFVRGGRGRRIPPSRARPRNPPLHRGAR